VARSRLKGKVFRRTIFLPAANRSPNRHETESPTMMVPARSGYRFRRGMSAAPQANPCACQYLLPGVPPIPGLPTCDPTTGTAPSCSAAQGNAPFCAGIPYGQPGYAQCIQEAQASTTVGALGTPTPVNPASYQAILASLPPPKTPSAATSTPSSSQNVGQSNAPNAATAGGGTAQSNAPNAVAATPVTVVPGCFSLFGASDPCLGPVGMWTLAAAAGAALLAFMMFGHK
jgi:hypothetical protein